MIGVRDAIEVEETRRLLHHRDELGGHVAAILADEMFALNKDTTPGHGDVDKRFVWPGAVVEQVSVIEDDIPSYDEYQSSLGRKMALLEGGLAYKQLVPVQDRTQLHDSKSHPSLHSSTSF